MALKIVAIAVSVLVLALLGINFAYDSARHNTQTEAVADTLVTLNDDWLYLFDGETLSGWRNYGRSPETVYKWRIEDGALVASQPGFFNWWGLARSQVFGGGNDDLVYARQAFSEFELSFEWKVPAKGNSGVFYLVTDESQKTASRSGFEYQVLDNKGHGDGDESITSAGAIYNLVAPSGSVANAAGEWNEARIRVTDEGIEHWLNGEKIVDLKRGSPEWNELDDPRINAWDRAGSPPEGYLVLQDHGDEVAFRKIRIKPF
ncbi:MAG: DUF1080 domain-containing protein [Pseudomonadota bacterium]